MSERPPINSYVKIINDDSNYDRMNGKVIGYEKCKKFDVTLCIVLLDEPFEHDGSTGIVIHPHSLKVI